MNTRKELELARQAMVRQLAEAEKELQKYAKVPEDNYPADTVLRFKKTIEVFKKGAKATAKVRYVEVMNDHMGSTERQRIKAETFRQLYGGGVRPTAVRPGDQMVVQLDAADFPEDVKEEVEVTYAALKIEDDRWFLTGPQSPRAGITWEELVEYLLEWGVKEYAVLHDPDKTVEIA